MRTKIFWLAVLALGFIYWRGSKAIAQEKSLECEYHLVYAICKQKGKPTELPTLIDVFKAGIKF